MADDDAPTGAPFRGVLCLEGEQTSDGRMIGLNETSWRDLPLTLMGMTKSSHGGMPSTETVAVGRIETIERAAAGDGRAEIRYTGTFDTAGDGPEFARLVGELILRGVSIDFAAVEDLVVTEEDEDGYPIDGYLLYTEVEILAATVCPMPAFAGAGIELVDPPEAEERDRFAPAMPKNYAGVKLEDYLP